MASAPQPQQVANLVEDLFEALKDYEAILASQPNDRESRDALRRALAALEEKGVGLFRAIFLDHHPAEWLSAHLAAALTQTMNSKTPLIIWVEGNWHSLPWELMRLPKDLVNNAPSRWLGEVAIISGFLRKRAPQHREILIDDTIRMVSLVGQHLESLDDELDFLGSLERQGVRVDYIRDLRAHKVREILERASDILSGPRCPHIIHAACHVRLDNRHDFVLSLHQNTDVMRSDLEPHFRVTGRNVSFLNTCHGLALKGFTGRSFAEFMVNRSGAIACVASGYRVSSVNAAKLSKLFLQRLLPLRGKAAMPVGECLFGARVELHRETRSLLGFCYRLLGRHDISMKRNARTGLAGWLWRMLLLLATALMGICFPTPSK
jgi:hypothetical protein